MPTKRSVRIKLFESVVNKHSKQIHQHGNASWDPINETTETKTVRQFLIKRNAGLDYLNRTVAPLISKDGRVVKFAALFLHGTPKVKGWTKTPKTGRKKFNGACELADLMSVFLYLDSGNTIRSLRCVLFQAKMKPSTGAHVIEDHEQRSLYDDCDGFDYVHGTVATAGESRQLPKAASRKKALQYAFVGPRPPHIRTIPSVKGKGTSAEYGEHLVQFLNGKTGLIVGKSGQWCDLVMELLAKIGGALYSDGKTKGPGIKDVLKHFNSFENKEIWCIDEGESGEGFGVQLVIVWDGELGEPATQTVKPPKTPVKTLRVRQKRPR